MLPSKGRLLQAIENYITLDAMWFSVSSDERDSLLP